MGDAGGEEGSLPLDGGSLEAFELLDGGEDSFFSGELRLGCEVVPVEEPAHEDGGGDGFDLLAQRAEGEAVDALQDATLAPLDFVGGGGWWVFEGAAEGEALQLHGEEGLEDAGGRDVGEGGEMGGGGGAEELEVALGEGEGGGVWAHLRRR